MLRALLCRSVTSLTRFRTAVRCFRRGRSGGSKSRYSSDQDGRTGNSSLFQRARCVLQWSKEAFIVLLQTRSVDLIGGLVALFVGSCLNRALIICALRNKPNCVMGQKPQHKPNSVSVAGASYFSEGGQGLCCHGGLNEKLEIVRPVGRAPFP